MPMPVDIEVFVSVPPSLSPGGASTSSLPPPPPPDDNDCCGNLGVAKSGTEQQLSSRRDGEELVVPRLDFDWPLFPFPLLWL